MELGGTKLEEILKKAEIPDSINERKRFLISEAGKKILIIDKKEGLRCGKLFYNKLTLGTEEYVLTPFGKKYKLKNLLEAYFF